MVGAGSVVTKDVPDFALVYGNPAVEKGYVCICAQKLSEENGTFKCICGKKFRKDIKTNFLVEME